MAEWNRIVVGLDGSECSKAALKWAAEEARRHGAELFAISAWTPPPVAYPFGGFPAGVEQQPAENARAVLEQILRDELGEDPGITVHSDVIEGNPSKVLIDLSKDADVVVIGTRGHGGFTGMLLGSVSQHVTAHAACTVVVAR